MTPRVNLDSFGRCMTVRARDLMRKFAAVTINVTSPDRTVTGQTTLGSGLRIELAEGVATERRTARSLAEQVEAVLQGLSDGKRQASDQAFEEVCRQRPQLRPDELQKKSRVKALVAMEQVDATGVSTEGHVTVECFGTRIFKVTISDKEMSRGDHAFVREEINSAIAEALREGAKSVSRIALKKDVAS